ncbi:hypothetical protein [Streptomyces griseorubiginosus]|uniref:hypothetical protein n=1 Tax=Streptomyces griseorubiginosus TaxID=67304 RepID=UPI0033DD629F
MSTLHRQSGAHEQGMTLGGSEFDLETRGPGSVGERHWWGSRSSWQPQTPWDLRAALYQTLFLQLGKVALDGGRAGETDIFGDLADRGGVSV